jgi:ABC-type tungstate transport system substrate-binding protein
MNCNLHIKRKRRLEALAIEAETAKGQLDTSVQTGVIVLLQEHAQRYEGHV